MHAPKIELRAHTYQYTTEIKIPVIKLEDLWLARHAQKKGRGGEGGQEGERQTGNGPFPSLLSPSLVSTIPLPFQGLSRR